MIPWRTMNRLRRDVPSLAIAADICTCILSWRQRRGLSKCGGRSMVPVCFRRREGHRGRDFQRPMDSHAAHYSERQSLGASPSFGVFDNALPADSLTLYMAPGRGCWPTAPGQPSAPASREGPGGVAARGWWSVRERLIGMCRTACRDGRVMWMSPLRHGGQPA